jgi:hypothetical protein
MAINSITGIDRDVDRFAIWRTSLNSFINLNAMWPVSDGGPIPGGNPDFRYYKRADGTPPDADHRFVTTSEWGRVEADPVPPVGHPSGTYEPIYTLTKLPLVDLLAQIETAFQQAVRTQFPDTDNPSTLILAAKALTKKQAGATLTTEENAILESVTSVGDAVAQLATRRQELIDAATADEDYDLTVWPDLSGE